jgi:hypothetical protein
LLKTTLEKLPDHQGVVHRTVNLTRKEIKVYKSAIGEVIIEPQFISASKSPLVARTLPKFTAKFRIISSHGKSIEDISYMPSEEEILFCAGTSFRVLEVTEHKGYVLIVMEEV